MRATSLLKINLRRAAVVTVAARAQYHTRTCFRNHVKHIGFAWDTSYDYQITYTYIYIYISWCICAQERIWRGMHIWSHMCAYMFSLCANSSARLLYMATSCAWQTTLVWNNPHMINLLLYHGAAYDSIVRHRRLTTQRPRRQHVWPSNPTTAFDDYEKLPKQMPLATCELFWNIRHLCELRHRIYSS